MILLHIVSLFLMSIIAVYMLNMKNKEEVQKNFFYLTICYFLWDTSMMIDILYENSIKKIVVILVCIPITFVPVFLYRTGLCLIDRGNKLNKKQYFLFIVPFITNIIVWTSEYHNWFIINKNMNVSGWYFYYVHTPYSYILITMWFVNMIKFAIKNGGYYSKQVMLIVIGTFVPFVANICLFVGITNSPYWTNIAFTVTAVCYFIAINRFNFLKISPLAYSTIFNNLQDGFIVIDAEWKVIDYNVHFEETFGKVAKVNRGDMLNKLITEKKLGKIFNKKVEKSVKISNENCEKIKFENSVLFNDEKMVYSIEVIPIKKDLKSVGTIIFIKDITEYKEAIQMVKKAHKKMVNQEKLASLGNLIGGISHNTKTSIMSVSGSLEGLIDLINEYKSSVGDSDVTVEDHHEIAHEMETWISSAKLHLKNINDLISAVKGQAVSVNSNMSDSFTVDELLHRVNVLLHFELRKHTCSLKVDNRVNINTTIKGEMSNLVQVLNNLISNAVYEYSKGDKSNGIIEFSIYESGKNLILAVKDYGDGINEEVGKTLFKEMITTKGKDGTGIGLYISYATITGKFEGKMWFKTEENKGTTFYMAIPPSRYSIKNYETVETNKVEMSEIDIREEVLV